MRYAARKRKKQIPPMELLESLASDLIANGMLCPVCKTETTWLETKGQRKRLITLQHDASGEMKLLCFSCNSKHGSHPGDSFYDLPEGHKRCWKCEKVKPISEFYKNMQSGCIQCSREICRNSYHANKDKRKAITAKWRLENQDKISVAHKAWREKNKEKLRLYELERTARRKQQRQAEKERNTK